MWSTTIRVRTAHEARAAVDSLERLLATSGTSEQSRADLRRDLGLVLSQAETQLARESVKAFNTERTFTGADYVVRFIASKSQPGLIERLLSAMGVRGSR